jgi:excisionase family DNA binding protein
LGCSKQTVRRWLDEGKLPKYVTHPTRRVRIPTEAVEKAAQVYPDDTD